MDKQYLAELMKLSEEINQEIYAELLGEDALDDNIWDYFYKNHKIKDAVTRAWGDPREIKNNQIKDAVRKAWNPKVNEDPKMWATQRFNRAKNFIKDTPKNFVANADMAAKNPLGWAKGRAADYASKIKANPGASAAAGGAALAGVAGVAGTLYAAKKAAERRGWMKNGCASISDPSKKAKCQAYLATKKK